MGSIGELSTDDDYVEGYIGTNAAEDIWAEVKYTHKLLENILIWKYVTILENVKWMEMIRTVSEEYGQSFA